MPWSNAGHTGRTDGPLLQKPSPQSLAIGVSQMRGIGSVYLSLDKFNGPIFDLL